MVDCTLERNDSNILLHDFNGMPEMHASTKRVILQYEAGRTGITSVGVASGTHANWSQET